MSEQGNTSESARSSTRVRTFYQHQEDYGEGMWECTGNIAKEREDREC
jgi:hypothetical protein